MKQSKVNFERNEEVFGKEVKSYLAGIHSSVEELESLVTLNELTSQVMSICDTIEKVKTLRVESLIQIAADYARGIEPVVNSEDVGMKYYNYIDCLDM